MGVGLGRLVGDERSHGEIRELRISRDAKPRRSVLYSSGSSLEMEGLNATFVIPSSIARARAFSDSRSVISRTGGLNPFFFNRRTSSKPP